MSVSVDNVASTFAIRPECIAQAEAILDEQYFGVDLSAGVAYYSGDGYDDDLLCEALTRLAPLAVDGGKLFLFCGDDGSLFGYGVQNGALHALRVNLTAEYGARIDPQQ